MLELDIGGDWIVGRYEIKALATLGKARWSRMRLQQGPDRIDLVFIHCRYPPSV